MGKYVRTGLGPFIDIAIVEPETLKFAFLLGRAAEVFQPSSALQVFPLEGKGRFS